MNYLAIGISLVSLSVSLWVFYTNQRNIKFQKLAELKQIAEETYWSMKYRLHDYKRLIEMEDTLNSNQDDSELVKKLEKGVDKALEKINFIEKKFRLLRFNSLRVRYSEIEQWKIDLNSIKMSVDISRRELFSKK